MSSSMMFQAGNRIDATQEQEANRIYRTSPDYVYRSKIRLQPVLVKSTSPLEHSSTIHLARNGQQHPTVALPPVTSLQKTSVLTSQQLPPVRKSVSPTRDVPSDSFRRGREEGRGLHERRGSCDEQEGRGLPEGRDLNERLGFQEGRGVYEGRGFQEGRGFHEPRGPHEGRFVQEQQVKAARRRELARRHLSNSLQGAKTVLPVLRRTQSFSVHAYQNGGGRTPALRLKRETVSLGPRKPAHDHEIRTHLTRRHSLREDHAGNKDSPHPLSLSLPQPSRGNVNLAELVHELNATMHYPPSPSRRHSADFSDNDDDTVWNFDEENGLDPDLCPRLTGKDTCSLASRALTPALRKLNRRRVSSRVRTQQWVNQIEAEERCRERSQKVTDSDSSGHKPPLQVSLIFEQEI